jgi:hypothetical protein
MRTMDNTLGVRGYPKVRRWGSKAKGQSLKPRGPLPANHKDGTPTNCDPPHHKVWWPESSPDSPHRRGWPESLGGRCEVIQVKVKASSVKTPPKSHQSMTIQGSQGRAGWSMHSTGHTGSPNSLGSSGRGGKTSGPWMTDTSAKTGGGASTLPCLCPSLFRLGLSRQLSAGSTFYLPISLADQTPTPWMSLSAAQPPSPSPLSSFYLPASFLYPA